MNVTVESNIVNSSLTSEERAAQIAWEVERQAKRSRWEKRKHHEDHKQWSRPAGVVCDLPANPNPKKSKASKR